MIPIYNAIILAIKQGCCVIFIVCTPHGPTPDGTPMKSDSCSKPIPQLYCDCNKFFWIRPNSQQHSTGKKQ